MRCQKWKLKKEVEVVQKKKTRQVIQFANFLIEWLTERSLRRPATAQARLNVESIEY